MAVPEKKKEKKASLLGWVADHLKTLVRWARRYDKSCDPAEVISDVYWKIQQKKTTDFPDVENPPAYARGIVRNLPREKQRNKREVEIRTDELRNLEDAVGDDSQYQSEDDKELAEIVRFLNENDEEIYEQILSDGTVSEKTKDLDLDIGTFNQRKSVLLERIRGGISLLRHAKKERWEERSLRRTVMLMKGVGRYSLEKIQHKFHQSGKKVSLQMIRKVFADVVKRLPEELRALLPQSGRVEQ